MLVDRGHLEDSAQVAGACMGCHGTRYTRGGIPEYARGTYGTPEADTCTATYSTNLPGVKLGASCLY